jgi:glucose-1-phosphate cytidylyltransferase
MEPIGYRPIVWHLMKYYAHYGHKDFILCLGYKADVIKNYFLNYNECVSNDFVLTEGGRHVKLLNSDIDSWSITFVDTGLDANLGQRLLAVKEHLKNEEVFLVNYSDNLTNVPLPEMMEQFERSGKIGQFISVRPLQSFHIVRHGENGSVRAIEPIGESDIWINGGFFIFRQQIFDYIEDGEELVVEPFQKLIRDGMLAAFQHTGFWACMDTFKERQVLEDMCAHGRAPWEVWKK